MKKKSKDYENANLSSLVKNSEYNIRSKDK